MFKTYVCPYCGSYHEASQASYVNQDTFECSCCGSVVAFDGCSSQRVQKQALQTQPLYDDWRSSDAYFIDNPTHLLDEDIDAYLY